ncbi:MAG: hypothetical protein HY908_30085 [Myxococcales bacterium]|nr:hypothetical protein [Myxococcales bacterium]
MRILGGQQGRRGALVAAATVLWATGTAVAGACSGKTVLDGTGGGTGGALVCSEEVADEVTTPVEVRLVNHTAADLYFGPQAACDSDPAFRIYDANDQELSRSFDGPCYASCSDMTTSCGCTVTYTCPATYVMRVAPQGALVLGWNGAYVAARTVPASCVACGGPASGVACKAYADPGPIPITFRAEAWTAADCLGTTCDCTPGPDGSCQLDGEAMTTGTVVTATAVLAPGGTSIDVVFQ